MNRIELLIDEKPVIAREGQTVLEVAQENGIHIPTLCYHKDLSPTGKCRMCVVDITTNSTLDTACTTQ
ncbi:MAG: ferredoxin, partial [Chloroflexi bacterium]